MKNKEALQQLNEEAEKYAIGCDEDDSMNTFIAGALSQSAANGCNKHVEKAKIEFAIKYINAIFDLLERSREVVECGNTGIYIDRIEIKSLEETKEKLVSKLSEKLKQYEN